MNEEKKETRQEKAEAKARVAASKALADAFKAYQRWQVAQCIALDSFIEPGDKNTFFDWVKDEIK